MPDVQEDEMGASDALDAAVDDLDNGELDGSADASDLGKLSKKDKKKAFNKVEKMAEDGIPDVADLDNDGEISGYEEKRHNAIQSNMDEDESGDALTRAIQAAIEIAERDGDKERAERLRHQLPHASIDVAEKKEVGFAKMGEPMGGGVRKPQGSAITYQDVPSGSQKTPQDVSKQHNPEYLNMNESEKKIRKYVQNKLAEMAGKKKPSINESKSTKLKALDKMIEEQYGLYNKKVKK
jgi:hypothetical protein